MGGHIVVEDLEDFKFINNSAVMGGGLSIENFPQIADDPLEANLSRYTFLKGFTFERNWASSKGGGLYIQCDSNYE